MNRFLGYGTQRKCAVVYITGPTVRGRWNTAGGVPITRQSLPEDPIGTFILTLTNVVAGSTLRVESQAAGTSLYDGTAATSSPVITLSCYASGSPLNDLRIKVRKGTTSPFYQPYETLATAIVGAQSIFASQIPDE